MLLTQEMATKIDQVLFQHFTVETLIEIAGQACAIAIQETYVPQKTIVLVGPGNNGNDAIVCARYLKIFGYDVSLIIPKMKEQKLGSLSGFNIPIITEPQHMNELERSTLIVDGLLGFNAKDKIREPYKRFVDYMAASQKQIVSVDIPSGWDISFGDIHNTNFNPSMLVSLTAPKECTKNYKGIHFIGGRFVNDTLANEFGIHIDYEGSNMVKRLQ